MGSWVVSKPIKQCSLKSEIRGRRRCPGGLVLETSPSSVISVDELRYLPFASKAILKIIRQLVDFKGN